MVKIEGMTEENAQAVALALYGLWFGVRLITCLGLLIFTDDGPVWAVIAWFVIGLARPSA